MDKLSKLRNYSECKLEDKLPDANKECAPNNTKKVQKTKSRIPVKKNDNSKVNTTCKIIQDVLQVEAKLENLIEPLQENSMVVLMVQNPEVKLKNVIEPLQEKPNIVLQAKNSDVRLENLIKSLREKPTVVQQHEDPEVKLERELIQNQLSCFTKSSELLEKEIQVKTVLTAQDIFRLRVPKPKTLMERVCNECNFYHVSESRYRKPIVVLDLDTLRLIYPAIVPDRKPTILNLLESVYKSFDIAIWSSMKMEDVISRLEMLELFRIQNKFKINFVLDKTSMISTFLTEYTLLKDMGVIWNLYPQYNEHNSIIINDYLKEIIYAIYKVPEKESKTIQLVDEVALKVVVEFLADTITSRRSLLRLNKLMANQYY